MKIEKQNKMKTLSDIEERIKKIGEEICELKEEVILENEENKSDIDDFLKCPITREYFVNPVTTKCGHTFEKNSLQEALLKNSKCPLCNTELLLCDNYNLSTNIVIQNVIDSRYPDYRKNRKTKECKDESWLKDLSETENKDKLDKTMGFLELSISNMITNGWRQTFPSDGSGWDYHLRHFITNGYVQKNVINKLKEIGFVLDYEIKNGNFKVKIDGKIIKYDQGFKHVKLIMTDDIY